ncbi:MAG: Rpn family recombination-promoting nuclease/putative transposase, partial [Lachnospiraceae bacterium]|nr:Rpn family recombination-promoting nuclease/putative transposase [Lachnospiraceae bacterium]
MIALIEHKSTVDYNVSMQLLRYMVYIWEDYEKEQEKLH